MSRVITLMPVRLAATRLPNKPLRVINGKTMVQRVYENVKKPALSGFPPFSAIFVSSVEKTSDRI